MTTHALYKDINLGITKLENDSYNLCQWLSDNAIKANPRKSHLLVNVSDNKIAASINNNLTFNEVEFLDLTIDTAL